jgi:hypothetical protein
MCKRASGMAKGGGDCATSQAVRAKEIVIQGVMSCSFRSAQAEQDVVGFIRISETGSTGNAQYFSLGSSRFNVTTQFGAHPLSQREV